MNKDNIDNTFDTTSNEEVMSGVVETVSNEDRNEIVEKLKADVRGDSAEHVLSPEDKEHNNEVIDGARKERSEMQIKILSGASTAAGFVPFAGGALDIANAITGKDLIGDIGMSDEEKARKVPMSGKHRIVLGTIGVASIAIDATGAGYLGKVAGKGGARVAELAAKGVAKGNGLKAVEVIAEAAAKKAAKGGSKAMINSSKVLDITVDFMKKNPKIVAMAEDAVDAKIKQMYNEVKKPSQLEEEGESMDLAA